MKRLPKPEVAFTVGEGQLQAHIRPVGDPDACDVLRLELTPVEGEEHAHRIDMTPCEALEIAALLTSTVQFYLYNQRQYRREILAPRLRIAAEREAGGRGGEGMKGTVNVTISLPKGLMEEEAEEERRRNEPLPDGWEWAT